MIAHSRLTYARSILEFRYRHTDSCDRRRRSRCRLDSLRLPPLGSFPGPGQGFPRHRIPGRAGNSPFPAAREPFPGERSAMANAHDKRRVNDPFPIAPVAFLLGNVPLTARSGKRRAGKGRTMGRRDPFPGDRGAFLSGNVWRRQGTAGEAWGMETPARGRGALVCCRERDGLVVAVYGALGGDATEVRAGTPVAAVRARGGGLVPAAPVAVAFTVTKLRARTVSARPTPTNRTRSSGRADGRCS